MRPTPIGPSPTHKMPLPSEFDLGSGPAMKRPGMLAGMQSGRSIKLSSETLALEVFEALPPGRYTLEAWSDDNRRANLNVEALDLVAISPRTMRLN